MRMLKVLGVAMLVAVVGGAAAFGVVNPGAEDTATVNASFSIPSWIALYVVGNGDVSFADITGVRGLRGRERDAAACGVDDELESERPDSVG